ncbi:hypothetical protein ACLOJK_019420 [Asimina triloba]
MLTPIRARFEGFVGGEIRSALRTEDCKLIGVVKVIGGDRSVSIILENKQVIACVAGVRDWTAGIVESGALNDQDRVASRVAETLRLEAATEIIASVKFACRNREGRKRCSWVSDQKTGIVGEEVVQIGSAEKRSDFVSLAMRKKEEETEVVGQSQF